MLDEHLIAKTYSKANENNVVFWKDYRITVLQDRLFRVEKSTNKKFRDDATLSVWHRNMPPQKFSVSKTEIECVIETEKCRLVIKEERKDCFVLLNGKKTALNNDGNLKGTFRTLDNCDGDLLVHRWVGKETVPVNKKIELENGVCSLSGVAVLDDSKSLTLGKDGQVKETVADGSDEYVFAYAQDYREAVKALYLICGKVPLLPKYALGNWWSRYHAYTDFEYLGLLNKFEELNIPFTVATIDMDWHYTEDLDKQFKITERGLNDEIYGGCDGWTGYSWNKKLFPDYKKFLKKLKSKNYAVTLNLHPALGVRWWEDAYEDMAKACGIDSKTKHKIDFDFTDEKYINAYFKILHKPYEKDGVDFWWIDWQQGQTCKIKGLDPLWSLNHYHFYDNALSNEKPLILSRYSGIGSHRYPVGFTGDTFISWKTLEYLTYFTANSTNIGYTWWSHDIGGHKQGIKDDELYLRFLQYGVFSPINRLHCMVSETATKEPWAYGGVAAIAEKFLRLRHCLIPFLYSANVITNVYGLSLIEPLYYRWNNEQSYRYKTQYIFGNCFIVAPVTEKTSKHGYAKVKVFLPEGRWTDIFTNDEYYIAEGGREFTCLRDLNSIPVFAESGGILPLSMDKGNGTHNPEKLEIRAYSGNGEYRLYEDKGQKRAVTTFIMKEKKTADTVRQTLTILEEGDLSAIPSNRKFFIKFCNIIADKTKVYINGRFAKIYPYNDCLALMIKHKTNINIEIIYRPISEIEKIVSRAKRIITEAEGDNKFKLQYFEKLKKSNDIAEFIDYVNNFDINDDIKKRLLEVIDCRY